MASVVQPIVALAVDELRFRFGGAGVRNGRGFLIVVLVGRGRVVMVLVVAAAVVDTERLFLLASFLVVAVAGVSWGLGVSLGSSGRVRGKRISELGNLAGVPSGCSSFQIGE